MKQTEALISAFQSVRNLTKFYLSHFNEKNYYKELNIDGVKFNTPYWITAHLVWTEHFLLIQGVGNKDMGINWLNKFEIGSKYTKNAEDPDINEIMETLEKVHAEAMKILSELPDDELDKPNHIDASFGGINSKRAIINHCIRHEPMHTGQLSWILKSEGIELV